MQWLDRLLSLGARPDADRAPASRVAAAAFRAQCACLQDVGLSRRQARRVAARHAPPTAAMTAAARHALAAGCDFNAAVEAAMDAAES